jgi:hypothetical protein
MPRLALPVAASLAFALMVTACGSDDSSSAPTQTAAATTTAEAEASVEAGATAAAEATAAPTTTAIAQATAAVEATAEAEATLASTPSGTPTPTPQPVVQIENENAFFTPYAEETIDQRNCDYDPEAAVVDCEELGSYALDPPADEDATCSMLLIGEERLAVTCTSLDPLIITYYEVAQP